MTVPLNMPVNTHNESAQVFTIRAIAAIPAGLLDRSGDTGAAVLMFTQDQVLTINGVTETWPKHLPVAFAPGTIVTIGTACNAFLM